MKMYIILMAEIIVINLSFTDKPKFSFTQSCMLTVTQIYYKFIRQGERQILHQGLLNNSKIFLNVK